MSDKDRESLGEEKAQALLTMAGAREVEVIKFCGMEISKYRHGNVRGYKLSQESYTKNLMHKYGMEACNSCPVVLPSDECEGQGNAAEMGEEQRALLVKEAQKIVGELIWLTRTRFDATYAVQRTAQSAR